jgi:signal transduction histidine kinase
MPEILLEQGLAEAVHAFCEKMSVSSSLHVDFHLSGFIPRLDPAFELSLYRMIQELIQNIFKHAGASSAIVQLDSHDPQLIVTIEDNGKGLDKKKIDSNLGTGLRNVISRVKALQGRFDIYSSDGKGTSINIEFDITHMKTTTVCV